MSPWEVELVVCVSVSLEAPSLVNYLLPEEFPQFGTKEETLRAATVYGSSPAGFQMEKLMWEFHSIRV